MKVALNITRENLGGITSTNLSLLNCLRESDDISFTGIEINPYRAFKSATVYDHLSPDWFDHHIVNVCDYSLLEIVKKSRSLKDVQKHYVLIIEVIRGILRKSKPDVLLINGTYYMPWLLSIAAQKERIPIVLWYAGVLTKEVEQMTPHFRKLFHAMERSIVKRAGRIIFPSQICQNVVYKDVYHSNIVKNGIIVPNPISPVFTRITKIEQSVQNRIAFVGRYSYIKNIDGFCALHKKLTKENWEHEATIVSNVPKKASPKIPKSIRVIPSMQPKDIMTFYSSQGLIVSPSYFETFGNVPVEAACIGIPVLVNKTMGCSEVLIDSGLGRMVVDFNDSREVLQRIKELCGQHILPRQINNLRKRVDPKYVAYEILAVINDLILSKKRRY